MSDFGVYGRQEQARGVIIMSRFGEIWLSSILLFVAAYRLWLALFAG